MTIDKMTSEASSLIEKLCSFKLILTAHIFMKIFQIIGPTSRYLQTKNMDLLTAWDMAEVTKSEITKLKFAFKPTHNAIMSIFVAKFYKSISLYNKMVLFICL